ncbi:MAG: hypothetical protein ACOZF0_06145 [Thermodesulfobacteriota bacterium]
MTSARISILGITGLSALFALVYAGLFLAVSNISYWYFTHTFLYAELFNNPGYHLYDWLWNLVGTAATLVCTFFIEFLRGFFRRRTTV